MKRIFSEHGLLAASLPGFELRQGQLAMAEQVAFALANEEILLYEAPTGTGKTLAYLIPALLADTKVVISTHTKALQEQILQKDLPLAERILGKKVKTALMKGRQNYLCKNRLRLFLSQPMFRSMDETRLFDRVQEWSFVTRTGDREELSDLPEDFSAWNDINANAHFCIGQKCSHFESCFFYRMRMRAMEADLVIVNHHLFFADLAVRESARGQAEVIPRYRALVLDEAHHIEDIATQFFGLQVSNYRVEELARDISRTFDMLKIASEQVVGRIKSLRSAADQFFVFFNRHQEEKYRLRPGFISAEMKFAHERFSQALAAMAETLANHKPADDPDPVIALEERGTLLNGELDRILDLEDMQMVHWCEIRRGGIFLNASPIELEGSISKSLFSCAPSMVLCSATMTTEGDFSFFKSRLGLTDQVMEAMGDSCFDYRKQAVLYLPRDIPEPNRPDYTEKLAAQMTELLLAAEGRAFCLFTSYRNMHAVHQLIASGLPYRVLLQGEGSKSALLDTFRRDEHSVLFATAGFWGGVDVVGPSLSMVLIDKLPFTSPGEPIVEARIESLKRKEANPFMEYQLPQAIISLRQGLGRLIRHRNDRGLLAVFDVRIRSKHYGKRILQSLPAFPVTGDLQQACEYVKRLNDPSAPGREDPI